MFSWYANMKTMPKLLMAFALVCIITAIVGFIGLNTAQSMAAQADQMYAHNTVPIDALERARLRLADMLKLTRDHILATDDAMMKTKETQIASYEKEMLDYLNQYKAASLMTAEEVAGLKDVDASWSVYKSARDDVLKLSREDKKDEAIAMVLDPNIAAKVGALTEDLKALVDINVKSAEHLSNQTNEQAASSTMIILIGSVIAVLVGLLLGVFVARSIAGPLTKLRDQSNRLAEGDLLRDLRNESAGQSMVRKDELGDLQKANANLIAYMHEMAQAAGVIAEGDLTAEVKPKSDKDELGAAFARMIANLRDSIGQVAESAENVTVSSDQLSKGAQQTGQATGQIASTIQEVAKGAGEQTQAVTESATFVNQMTIAIDQVAQNAQSVAASSSEAAGAAKLGSDTVGKAVEAMGRIKGAIAPAADTVKELGVRSAEIGNIVEVIDDIAEQTNLLALNAAIEAARAGEHGKGFAVVADEVRKLAERSSKATKEIANLIGNVQKGTEEAVRAMQVGTDQVQEGSRLAAAAGDSLGDILQAFGKVNDQVQSISAAAQEMTASSTQVVRAIDNISSISEENAASAQEVSAATEEMSAQVEETAASAEQLAQLAGDLQDVVARFTLPSQSSGAVVQRRRQTDWKAKQADPGSKVARIG